MARSTILGDIKGGLIASPSCLAFSIANGALRAHLPFVVGIDVERRLEATRPFLVVAILRDIVRLQSERLAFATRQNAARA